MIESVTSSSSPAAPEALKPATKPAPPAAGFAAVLSRAATRGEAAAAAAKETKTGGAAAPAPAKETKTGGAGAPDQAKPADGTESRRPALERSKFADGEQWKPVKGHTGYVEITAGARKGQFVNVSGNDRDGRTFTVEQREGRTVHVYGTGTDRLEVAVADDEGPKKTGAEADTDPPADEVWAPVKNHRGYVDITDGTREDLFVNLSGNSRHGRTFRILERDGRILHVYGTGADKQEIQVRTDRHRDAVPKPEVPAKPEASKPKPAGGAEPL